MFRRPDAAAAAKLFIVAAGPAEQIERCRPLFDAIGQKTFIAGEEAHAANVIKLGGNFLITTVIESLAEAFAFGRKFGVDPHAFLDILTNSLFTAPVYRNYGSMIAADNFESRQRSAQLADGVYAKGFAITLYMPVEVIRRRLGYEKERYSNEGVISSEWQLENDTWRLVIESDGVGSVKSIFLMAFRQMRADSSIFVIVDGRSTSSWSIAVARVKASGGI